MSDDETCESCVYWNTTEYGGKARRSSGEPQPGSWGYCLLVSDSDDGDGDERLPTALRAFTLDSSDYRSWLMTRNDFGCIEHHPDGLDALAALTEEPT